MIEKYLLDLESRIDSDVEDKVNKNWLDFWEDKVEGKLFLPARGVKKKESIEWPFISVNEALQDYEKMALQQLKACSSNLEFGSGSIMNVRCNYGTSIMMSLFGAEIWYMEDKYNTLPTSKPLPGGLEAVKRLLQRGVPSLDEGFGSRVFEMGHYFKELLSRYDKVSKYVHVYHPDLQGPMDICEVLLGSDLFYYLVDEPALIHEFLELITETYIAFMKRWLKLYPYKGEYSAHWGLLQKGCIMLRDDSAMNMSPDFFEEFIKPYDSKILKEFGGGTVHFCGRGDHYIERLSNIEGVYAINMSQPEYNDMEKIYKNTVDKGIKIIGFSRGAAEEAIQVRNLKGNVHCY
jgi:hypothetical protein